jgi:hypothetical protein
MPKLSSLAVEAFSANQARRSAGVSKNMGEMEAVVVDLFSSPFFLVVFCFFGFGWSDVLSSSSRLRFFEEIIGLILVALLVGRSSDLFQKMISSWTTKQIRFFQRGFRRRDFIFVCSHRGI